MESQFLSTLWYIPLVFKPAQGTHLPDVQPSGWGAQYVVQTPQSPGRISQPVISPSSCLFPAARTGPSLIPSPPFLPDFMWVFLYSLGCKRAFLPVSSLFSARVAPHIDLFLMHSLGEVSPMSYSTILISPFLY